MSNIVRRAGLVSLALTALALPLATLSPVAVAAPPGDEGASITTVAPGTIAGSVSAGAAHSCAVRTDGTLVCWGNDDDGQASPPQGTYITVTAGAAHSSRGADGRSAGLLGQRHERAGVAASGHLHRGELRRCPQFRGALGGVSSLLGER